jgi:hypothetical protein
MPVFTIGACGLLCWAKLVRTLYANLDIFFFKVKGNGYLYDFY